MSMQTRREAFIGPLAPEALAHFLDKGRVVGKRRAGALRRTLTPTRTNEGPRPVWQAHFHIQQEMAAVEQLGTPEPRWSIDVLRTVPAEPQHREIPHTIMSGGVLFDAKSLPLPKAGPQNGFHGRLRIGQMEFLTRDERFGQDRFGRDKAQK